MLQAWVLGLDAAASSLQDELRTLTTRLARVPFRHRLFCASPSGSIWKNSKGHAKVIMGVAASILA
eukprot:1915146-Pleurochrysis_carterae.AAC.2